MAKEKKPKFQTPTGMHDILPPEQKYFDKVLRVVEKIADFYGFLRIETPILEKADLFSRGIGLSTEIVKKQMYILKTEGGDVLALRPEGTASVVRAYIEHGMKSRPQPVKLWYFGPFFRHERPQAGRFRQFWQFGFEVLGQQNPVLDALIIQMACNALKDLKFKDLVVEVNSIGCSQCRPYSKRLLKDYFSSQRHSLCPDCKKRLKENVLRILDCKSEKCQRIKRGAPQIIDHLCKECHNHFKEVLEFLDEIELAYHLNPYLVRGLDYYTKTVFEIFEKGDDQALAGGGRYDDLAKILGGEDMPGVGMAAGIERVIVGMKEKALRYPQEKVPKVFLAQIGQLAKRKSLRILEEFQKARIPMAESLDRDSLRSQLDRANRIGVRYVLILGQKEVLEGKILLRDMKTGKQKKIKLDELVKIVKKL